MVDKSSKSDESPESGEASGPDMSKYAVNDAMLDVLSNHRLSAREREQPRKNNNNADLADMAASLQRSREKEPEPKKSKYGDLADIDDILNMRPGNLRANLGLDIGEPAKPSPKQV